MAAKDTSSDLNALAQGGQFTQQRVQSYADIIDSPDVAQTVSAQLSGSLTPKQIADEVTASAPLNTVLIDVHATDRSPARAQFIANAISEAFASFAAQLETPAGSTVSPVKVTVVKRATLPRSPVSPRKKLDLILGLLSGLAIGIGGAVVRESLDTTIKDADRLQRDAGLPVLGAIAYDREAKRRPLFVHADKHSGRAEAFRQVRTNLQFIDIDRPPRSIVVTSSVPNEGKTTTAANLAIALAQGGMRTLLIESDLRRPKVAEYLGIEGGVGLTTVLIGQCDLADAIQPWGEDGLLSVLPSGPTPPNPSELLGSRGMAAMIRELEDSYDLVLVDAPPLLPVTDAAVIASVVSGALVVARYGHTQRQQLARAVQSLRAVDAAIYGVVLTMTPAKGPDAYHYGYRYDGNNKRDHAELVVPVARAARIAEPAASEGRAGHGQPAVQQPRLPALRAPYPNGLEHLEPLQFFRH